MSSVCEVNELTSLMDSITTSNPDVGKALQLLSNNLDEKNGRITMLENTIYELETRMLDLERHNSKDCVIIQNLPINNVNNDLSLEVCKFFKERLSVHLNPGSFQACHYLSRPNDIRAPLAVIVKFIYFKEKDAVYMNRKLLKGFKNPANNRFVFINERLPEKDNKVMKHARSLNLATSSYN